MSLHSAYAVASIALLAIFTLANRARAMRYGESLSSSLFRPSQIITGYCIIFYMFGAIFFASDNILSSEFVARSRVWTYSGLVLWSLSMVVAIIITNINLSNSRKIVLGTLHNPKISLLHALAGTIVAILLAFTEFYPLTIVSFSFFLCAYGNMRRVPGWLLVLSFLAVAISLPAASFSKRNVIFPVIIVLMLLWERGVIPRKLAILFGFLSLFAIIPMSILRGYGSYDVDSFFEAMLYSYAYITDPQFLKFLANNLEFSSFYFHGVNSVEIFLRDEPYLWGSSLVRVLLSPFIYLNILDGLDSSIQVYTQAYDPVFRSIGGSYPVNLFAEVFMNFGVYAIIVYSIICVFIDKLINCSILFKHEFARFAFRGSFLFCTLLLARGSGFSLFLFNLVIAIVSIYIIVIHASLVRKQKRLGCYRSRKI